MNTHSHKNILITGGAGFIGSYLCEKYLEEGHKVYCLDNLQTFGSTATIDHLMTHARFSFIKHDVINPLVLGERMDWIFHFACSGSPAIYQYDPVHTWKTNTIGTLNMLELARASGARFMLASTSEVYGNPEVTPQNEEYTGNVSTIGPRACYDEGKRAAESITMDFHRQYGTDVKIIRIFNTYGPRMNPNEGRAITDFIGDALGGKSMKSKPGILVLYGDGTPKRSFQYIDDLIAGIDVMMRHPQCIGPVNLGNPGEITMLDLAKKIVALAGTETQIVLEGKNPTHDPTQRCPDITRAQKELNWQPTISLEEGLKRTMVWFALQHRPDKEVLVFATTYYPVLGPAERVFFELSQTGKETEYHIITSRFRKELPAYERLGTNHIYRIGFGSRFDKYLLPLLGFKKALELSKQHTWDFIWSIMASYGGLAARRLKKHLPNLSLLVTLDTAEFEQAGLGPWIRNILNKSIFASANSVFVADQFQESTLKRMFPHLLIASRGDIEQVRTMYVSLYNAKRKQLNRPR